jgi:hypothetical protein
MRRLAVFGPALFCFVMAGLVPAIDVLSAITI